MVKQGRPLKQGKKVQLFVYVEPSIKDAITDDINQGLFSNYSSAVCSILKRYYLRKTGLKPKNTDLPETG